MSSYLPLRYKNHLENVSPTISIVLDIGKEYTIDHDYLHNGLLRNHKHPLLTFNKSMKIIHSILQHRN